MSVIWYILNLLALSCSVCYSLFYISVATYLSLVALYGTFCQWNSIFRMVMEQTAIQLTGSEVVEAWTEQCELLQEHHLRIEMAVAQLIIAIPYAYVFFISNLLIFSLIYLTGKSRIKYNWIMVFAGYNAQRKLFSIHKWNNRNFPQYSWKFKWKGQWSLNP